LKPTTEKKAKKMYNARRKMKILMNVGQSGKVVKEARLV